MREHIGTIGWFIRHFTHKLRESGVSSARLDVLVLLEHELASDRAHLLAHPEQHLSLDALGRLAQKCARRAAHVPLAYLTNTAYFYGRTFIVSENVLVPRPESEEMISYLHDIVLPQHPRIADIGTGSGCLGITAALEVRGARTTLCDISPEALAVAERNVRAHNVRAHVVKTDLLDGCPLPQDVLLANLPYVPDAHPINQAASHEPKLALFAGSDGLNAYRKLFMQITTHTQQPTYIITESLGEQHIALTTLAGKHGHVQKGQARGLAQLFVRQ